MQWLSFLFTASNRESRASGNYWLRRGKSHGLHAASVRPTIQRQREFLGWFGPSLGSFSTRLTSLRYAVTGFGVYLFGVTHRINHWNCIPALNQMTTEGGAIVPRVLRVHLVALETRFIQNKMADRQLTNVSSEKIAISRPFSHDFWCDFAYKVRFTLPNTSAFREASRGLERKLSSIIFERTVRLFPVF